MVLTCTVNNPGVELALFGCLSGILSGWGFMQLQMAGCSRVWQLLDKRKMHKCLCNRGFVWNCLINYFWWKFDHSYILSSIVCKSCSLLAMRAISSAYNSIATKTSSTGTPKFYLFISSTRSLIYMLNNWGDIRQPCFKPVLTQN